MATMLPKLFSRPNETLSAEELDRFATVLEEERNRFKELSSEMDGKVAATQQLRTTLKEMEARIGDLGKEQKHFQERLQATEPLLHLLDGLEAKASEIEEVTERAEDKLEKVSEKSAQTGEATVVLEQLIASARSAEAMLRDFEQQAQTLGSYDHKVRALSEQLDHHQGQSSTIVKEYRQLSASGNALKEELQQIKEGGKLLSDELSQAREMARSLEDTLTGLGSAKALASTTEEQLRNLNALAGHVGAKLRSLNQTQEELERAERQRHQVNEMVWEIEKRLEKVDEEQKLIAATEDQLERLQELHRELTSQVEEAQRHHREFAEYSTNLGQEASGVVARLEEQLERSSIAQREVEIANERVTQLNDKLRNQEAQVERLSSKDHDVAEAMRKNQTMLTQLEDMRASFDAIAQQAQALEPIKVQIAELADLNTTVEERMRIIEERSTRVESTHQRLQEVGEIFATTEARLQEMRAGQADVEQVLEQLMTFRSESLQLKEQAAHVTSRLADVDRVNERLDGLHRLSEEVEARAIALAPRLELVEGVESRLSQLKGLNDEIDSRIERQLTRQAELDAMSNTQEALGLQLTDLQKLADSLQDSKRYNEMEARLRHFETRLESAMGKVDRCETLGTSLVDNEQRLSGLEGRLSQATESLTQHGGQLEKLDRDAQRAVKLHADLRQQAEEVEVRQRELEIQGSNTEQLMEELRSLHRQVEERRSQLLEFEQRVDQYESKVDVLDGSMEKIDHRIDSINTRHELVGRIKREMDEIFETCEQSRLKTADVLAASKQVAATGSRLEALSGAADQLGGRLRRLETKVDGLEVAEFKLDALHNLLGDIDINLENFHQQSQIIDHLSEKLSLLDSEIKNAELTAASLRQERQLATRIQEGIQALRQKRAATARPLSLIKGEVAEAPETDNPLPPESPSADSASS